MVSELTIGDITAKYLEPLEEAWEAEILEERVKVYKEKFASDNIDFPYRIQGASDIMTYAEKLPGMLGEMTVSTAHETVEFVCNTLEAALDDFPEPFELYHLIAINELALSERYTKDGEDEKNQDSIALAYHHFKAAHKAFINAHGFLITMDTKLPGSTAANLTDWHNGSRKRLGFAGDQGYKEPEEEQVKEVLEHYKIMFDNYTFTNKDEAGTNIARYLDAMSYTIQNSEDLMKYQELAQTLDLRFQDRLLTNHAVKDTLYLYNDAEKLGHPTQ